MPAQITALPTPPSTNDPANFNTRADAFLGQMPTFVTEANALAGEVNANTLAAATSATSAANKAVEATGKASEAAASAASALNAPGTSGSSSTSLTIGVGSQSFTTQTGKAWVAGQGFFVASSASPTNYMTGVLTAYNSGTGAATVVVDTVAGSGTFAAWNVGLAAGRPWVIATQAEAEAGTDNAKVMTPLRTAQAVAKLGASYDAEVTTNTILTASSNYGQIFNGAYVGGCFYLPDATTLPRGPRFAFMNKSLFDLTIRDSAGNAKIFIRSGQMAVCHSMDNSSATGDWRFDGGSYLGTTAQFDVSTGGATNESLTSVRIDADRDLVVYFNTTGNVFSARVWNKRSATWGAAATLMSGGGAIGFARALLIGVDKVLVVMPDSTNTGVVARVLSLGGVVISAGTAATATGLSANAFNMSNGYWLDLLAVGSTYALTFQDTLNLKVVGFMVSGTTVTIGSAATAVILTTSPSSGFMANMVTNTPSPTLMVLGTTSSEGAVLCRAVTFSGTTANLAPTTLSLSNGGTTYGFYVFLMSNGSLSVITATANPSIQAQFVYWTGSAWAVGAASYDFTTAGWPAPSGTINSHLSCSVIGSKLLLAYQTSSSQLFLSSIQEGAAGAVSAANLAPISSLMNANKSVNLGYWGGFWWVAKAGSNLSTVYKIEASATTPSLVGQKVFSAQTSNGVYDLAQQGDALPYGRSATALQGNGVFVPSVMCGSTHARGVIWNKGAAQPVVVDVENNSAIQQNGFLHADLRSGGPRSDGWSLVANPMAIGMLIRKCEIIQ